MDHGWNIAKLQAFQTVRQQSSNVCSWGQFPLIENKPLEFVFILMPLNIS